MSNTQFNFSYQFNSQLRLLNQGQDFALSPIWIREKVLLIVHVFRVGNNVAKHSRELLDELFEYGHSLRGK